MDVGTLNIVLDVILIVASVWMVIIARGVGGVVGKTLTYIVIGAVILGLAHLQATITGNMKLFVINEINYNGTIHRVVVIIGFIVLVMGFRQLQAMKR